jgi:hypothetical protein
MKPFTGSSRLLCGGGCFRFGGTGLANAFDTVFRDTLYRWNAPAATPSNSPNGPCESARRSTHATCTHESPDTTVINK